MDGDAEDRAEAGGEDEQPHQRTHQGGEEAPALPEETQQLTAENAREGPSQMSRIQSDVSWPNASARLSVPDRRHSPAGEPCARTRPRCSTTT